MKMLWHKSCACYIFVASLILSVAAAVTTGTLVSDVQPVSIDGLEESSSDSTATPVISTSTEAEFSSRQGVNGFKPSVEYARFAEQRASASNKNSTKIKFSDEVRTKKHIRKPPPPAALKLYESNRDRDQFNSSSSDQVEKEESLPKLPTLFYGDIAHTKPYPLHGDPQINNIDADLKEHHHHHHENHNYGEGDKGDDDKYYFPKNLLSKDGPHEHPGDYDHGHHEHHPIETPKVNYGHAHGGYGYGYPEHHDHHDHHHHSHGHSFKFTDHYKGHNLEGAVGKALHLLIPAGLFLGGVSALFPNRVHVPTTNTKYRHKRATSFQAGNNDPADFEDIPAQYLRREHRSDDGGIELDLDEGENPFLLPLQTIRPPLSSGGRHGHINYNSHLNPHQRFELSPPNTQRTPTRLRHRQRQAGQNRRPIPEQYDAFFFNNPVSYNFDIPAPTFSPDDEPSPIPPTFPTNRLQPTEEMVSEEEAENKTTTTAKPKSKKSKSKNRNTVRAESAEFVPIPIEEPVLDIFQDITTETGVDTTESTTTRTPAIKKKIKTVASGGSISNREGRRDIINPLQSLEAISSPSPNQIPNTTGKDKRKDVDLSPDGPVIGLLNSYAQHDKDSPQCQKKALCQLAMKGSSPVGTKFESFLWNLANLVPDQFSQLYDLEEIFHSIRNKECNKFLCDIPNLDIQV